MSFSGITLKALTYELNNTILNGKIQKISQPEPYGINIAVYGNTGHYKLYISANASLPLIYLTDENKPSPINAYNFVMVLRKHIANAKIIAIEQIGLERVLKITLEHLDELKDVAKKHLYIEIMGKHSNIIFTDEDDKIIDAIKHVGSTQSSVREVLPGRDYFIPAQNDRMNIEDVDRERFYNKVLTRTGSIAKVISSHFCGFSMVTGYELANRCGLDGDIPLNNLHETEKQVLCDEFIKLKDAINNNDFSPMLCLDDRGNSVEFSAFNLTLYEGTNKISMDSISEVIKQFYAKKSNDANIHQKAGDIKKLISVCIDRANKKLALQKKQLSDTQKMDKYRIYGELLQAYGYTATPGDKEITVENYYDDNNPITIPLDPTLSAIDTSKKYFVKYEKLKRTRDAVEPQIEHTLKEIDHLSSILTSLLMSEVDGDIANIKKELYEFGYIKKRPDKSKTNQPKANKPMHFKTADGFELFVGKNNYQNEEVTFKIAKGNDWWFHAKGIPGSHVVLKDDGREIPDEVFEIAANLAAYYSSNRDSLHVEVDYLKKKDVKRVNGAAPGYVIYYTNYSMLASPDISSLSREP